jgi:hypothetical protein
MNAENTQNQIKKIQRRIKNDRKTIIQLEHMIREMSTRISNNENILETICNHQWKITRDLYDDHSMKSCHICGLEKY